MYSKKVSDFVNHAVELSKKMKYEQAASKYADACATFKEENSCDDFDLLVQQGKMLLEAGIVKKSALGGLRAMRAEVAAERRANLLNHPEKSDKAEGEKSAGGNSSVKDSPVENSPIKDSPVEDSSVKDSSVRDSSDRRSFDEDLSDEEFSDEEFSDEDDCEEEWEEENPTEFEAAKKVLKQAISLYEKEYTKHEEDAKSLTEPYLNSDADVPKSRFVEIVKKLADTYDLLGDVSTELEMPGSSSHFYGEGLFLYKKLYHNEFSAHVAMALANYASASGFYYTAMDEAAKDMKQAIKIFETLRKLRVKYAHLTRNTQPERNQQEMMMRAIMSQFGGSQL
ncbi:hypothetical protein OXX80_009645 [Metschnikowia pulcherrima]